MDEILTKPQKIFLEWIYFVPYFTRGTSSKFHLHDLITSGIFHDVAGNIFGVILIIKLLLWFRICLLRWCQSIQCIKHNNLLSIYLYARKHYHNEVIWPLWISRTDMLYGCNLYKPVAKRIKFIIWYGLNQSTTSI